MTISDMPQPSKATTRESLLAFRVPEPAEAVGLIREKALARARQKLPPIERGLDAETLLQRAEFLESLKYGLAAGIAEALALTDPQVQSVYTFDPGGNPDLESGAEAPPDPIIHLLLLVAVPSAALSAFIASLDRALTAELQRLPSRHFAEITSVLDVNLITPQDVRRGTGYAGLLRALFMPPLQIWPRRA